MKPGKSQRKKNKRIRPREPGCKEKKLSPKAKGNIIAKVKKIADPLSESEGIELVHIEHHQEAVGKILRIYIDKPGGVTLEDCVNISRQLGDLLDVDFENDFPYRLEVSSPGLDRPLTKESDFERFKGQTAKIRTAQPLDGQKNFKGILLGISEGTVKLMINDKPVAIPYLEITRAQLVNYNGDSECL
ncbi:MAG: ribosome maturation factor RimP [Deltaproteobacteria bacterium]|nr:ribosome maturation factor RimP [Deltaproteobacteria bacterium]